MRKKLFYFATLALTSFGFACFTFAGCDISLNLGEGGTAGGDQVTQEEWVEIFSDSERYINYTSLVEGTVTTSGVSVGSVKLSGKILLDGKKSYYEIKGKGTDNGEKVDTTGFFYEYLHAGRAYMWFHDNTEDVWHRPDGIVGLTFIELSFLDYSDCYDCFTYNSTTHVYEAKEEGLPILSEKVQMQLSKFSFKLKDGVPSSAEIIASISAFETTVSQNCKYTFCDYNKTKVTLPDQIKSDLLELGIQAE